MQIIIGQILKTERNDYWIKEQLERALDWMVADSKVCVWIKKLSKSSNISTPPCPTVETTEVRYGTVKD
jgi:hypothetical protein